MGINRILAEYVYIDMSFFSFWMAMRFLRRGTTRTILLAAMLPLCAAVRLQAQEAPSPGASPTSNAQAPIDETTDTPTFKTQTNLVSVFFTVRGKDGLPITNLDKSDCTIYEDKVAQTTKNFERMTNLPLSMGIMLDTSGSQQNVLQLEKDTGGAFLRRILRPKDEAFLISFDSNIDLLADYTNNASQLIRAMNKAQINVPMGSSGIAGMGNGPVNTQRTPGTLLYDAVFVAAHDKLHQEAGRKVLIMLTDGEDEGSQLKMEAAIEAAQKSNAIIYVILIADRRAYAMAGEMYSGAGAMEKMTKDTGGRMIDVGNNGNKLEDAFAQIENDLRTQYLLSYTPLDTRFDGAFRYLNMNCKSNGKVQMRKGYYALASAAGTD